MFKEIGERKVPTNSVSSSSQELNWKNCSDFRQGNKNLDCVSSEVVFHFKVLVNDFAPVSVGRQKREDYQLTPFAGQKVNQVDRDYLPTKKLRQVKMNRVL